MFPGFYPVQGPPGSGYQQETYTKPAAYIAKPIQDEKKDEKETKTTPYLDAIKRPADESPSPKPIMQLPDPPKADAKTKSISEPSDQTEK